jgi:hypothetical protein
MMGSAWCCGRPTRSQTNLLGAGQIDQVEVTGLGLASVDIALADADDKDRVRARTLGVHVLQRAGSAVGRSDREVLQATHSSSSSPSTPGPGA